MYPSDDWLLLLNFYLITCSGEPTLCTLDFSDERLAQAYRENPGESFHDMVATATKLVLEFQAQNQDTESQNDSPTSSPCGIGENEETPNGPIPISLPNLPSYV